MSENNENKTDSKSSEKKIADDYYSTNDYNGKDKVYQVKFDGETIWKVHAKLKYGEVRSRVYVKEIKFEIIRVNCALQIISLELCLWIILTYFLLLVWRSTQENC